MYAIEKSILLMYFQFVSEHRNHSPAGSVRSASEVVVRRRLALTLIVLCLAVGSAVARPAVRFQHLTTGDGLSQGLVHRILQDRQGFMWFATDDGLNRFDGYDFKTFRSQVDTPGSLGSNTVFDIVEDSRGRLWAGAWGGGLSLFDRGTERFTTYRADAGDSRSLSDDRVNCLLPDPSGGLWIGTEGGLNFFNPETGDFTHHRSEPGNPASLSDDWVISLHLDRGGALWVGTLHGLNRFDKSAGSFTRFWHDAGNQGRLPQDQVLAIAEDSAGRLWAGTSGGLFHLDLPGGEFKRFATDPGQQALLGEASVSAILEDREGTLWFGTKGGLFRLDPKNGRVDRFTHDPAAPDTLVGNEVISLGQDRSGVIWVGSRGQGLSTYKPGRLKFVPRRTEKTGAAILQVHGILMDGEKIWVGTRSGLKCLDLAETPERESVRPDLRETFSRAFAGTRNLWEGREITTLCRDRTGTVWIAVRDAGLYRLSLDGGRSVLYPNLPHGQDAVRGNQILELFFDRSGIAWVGTDGSGLIRLDPRDESVVSYRHNPLDTSSIGNDYAMAMAEDAGGILWVGTWGGGISRLDRATGKFEHLAHRSGDIHSLSHDIVTCVFRDSREWIWVGTYGGGLNRYDRARGGFERLTVKDGLANDVVCGILEDSRGELWISTYGGLSRFNPSNRRFTNYTEADGLQAGEFNLHASARSPDGLLIFGGPKGVNAFRPDDIAANSFVPPLVFTGYRRLVYGGPLEDRMFVGAEGIDLSYRDSLTLGFAALDYTNTRKNQYTYELEGSYAEWVHLGNRHEITFANLAPGNYTLLIRGSNDEGVWNERGISALVVVHPPYFQTWWFRLALAALAVVLLFCSYRAWSSRQRERTKLKLMEGELSVAERIQCSMLPNKFPPFPGRSDIDIFARMIPARHVGGDFYDFYLVSPDRLAFAMGDVSGKGVPAAMQMSLCRVLIKGAAKVGRPVHEVAEVVNNTLVEELPSDTFITAFLGILELSTGRLDYVRAGHNPPAIVRASGAVDFLEDPINFFLGKFPKTSFEPGMTVLDPGDTLMLYTDGITEAPGSAGDFLGEDQERFRCLLRSAAGLPLPEAVQRVLAEVERHSLGIPQSDDRTLMLIRRMPR